MYYRIKLKELLEARFNPSMPRAQVSPEWEAIRDFHRKPEITKLRAARIWNERPSVTVWDKDRYAFVWTSEQYGPDAVAHEVELVFSVTSNEFAVEVWIQDDYDTEYVAKKKGRGNPAAGFRLATQLSKKLDDR